MSPRGYLLLALPVALVAVAAGDEPPAPPKQSPEVVFRAADANRDGKLSRDEFVKFTANAPRFRDNPDQAKQVFDRLDANADGSLTVEEFRRIAELFGAAGKAFGKAKAKPRETPEKPAVLETPATPEQLAFFEKKVRPVLSANCYQCHSEAQGKVKGGLVLDTKEGVRNGGSHGPAVVPGDAKSSLLVKAVQYGDEHLKMPPKAKLSDEAIADLEAWVATGAADPRDGKKTPPTEIDIAKGKEYWAFRKPKAAPTPAVKNAAWPRDPLDHFVLAGLEAKNLKPVADADPRILLRRVSFDLTGLPPTPEAIEAFAVNPTPAAFAAYVDKQLASPAFGERWGRHWLDVARYGESSGKQVNMIYPHAWRYRDYVIASFNADKPFDQFVREQIAGDLLPASDEAKKAEQVIATGFLAIGAKSHNERNRLQFEMDLVDEQIDAMSQAFLGLTVACARCHDHKFDPVPMKDYYALAGIFRSSETCFGTARVIQNFNSSVTIALPAKSGVPVAVEPLTKDERQRLEKQIQALREERGELTRKEGFNGNPRALQLSTQIAQAESKLEAYDADGSPKRLAMGVREKGRTVDSPMFVRGEIDHPAGTVQRGVVQVLSDKPVTIRAGSGRRELAEWVASRDNPLTARVIVNRVWLQLFGRGLVATPDNFGAAGQRPSNQALLDSLAVRFVADGWSVKKLVRAIVLSRAYQMSSDTEDANLDVDPDNTLVWRAIPRRLDAEAIRDSLLVASRRLDATPPVGSPVAKVGDGNALLLSRGRGPGMPTDTNTRSVYLPILRNMVPEALSLFDFAEPELVTGERSTTTVPSQALFLLNNPFVIKQAEALAERLAMLSGDDERVRHSYLVAFGRQPTESEVANAREFVGKYIDLVKGKRGETEAKRVAWTSYTQALFGSAEFLYVY